jgi:hypothetical protein
MNFSGVLNLVSILSAPHPMPKPRNPMARDAEFLRDLPFALANHAANVAELLNV